MEQKDKNEKAHESKPVAKKRAGRVKVENATQEVRMIRKSLFDWESLIPLEHFEIESAWLTENGIAAEGISEEQKAELKERCGPKNLFIKLSGFKYLAHLRGIDKLEYHLHSQADTINCVCNIRFPAISVENGEATETFPAQEFSGIGSANEGNCAFPFSKFLASMAENRAFIRAVKSAFNINTLGYEEVDEHRPALVDSSGLLDNDECTSPQQSLALVLKSQGKTFEELKGGLLKKEWPDCKNWNQVEDVPSDQCCILMDRIRKKKVKEESENE